jgi:hypothetical protein
MSGAKRVILHSATILPTVGDEINDPAMLEAARLSRANNPGKGLVYVQFQSASCCSITYNYEVHRGSINILDNAEDIDATGVHYQPVTGDRYGYATLQNVQVPVTVPSKTRVVALEALHMNVQAVLPTPPVVNISLSPKKAIATPPPLYVSHTYSHRQKLMLTLSLVMLVRRNQPPCNKVGMRLSMYRRLYADSILCNLLYC